MTLRWPPIYHPVIVGSFNVTVALLTTQWSEWLAVSRIHADWLFTTGPVVVGSFRGIHGDVSIREDGQISQLRRLLPWRMTLCINKVRRQGKVCRVKLLTSMLSWLRTTVAGECCSDYWSNTQTKLICITIAQPKSWDCMDRRWQGWMVGRKTTDEVGCLNTLMNSLNEVISVHFARKLTTAWTDKSPWTRKFTPKLSNPPRPLKILQRNFEGTNVVLRKYLRITFASRQNKHSL